MNNPAFTEAEKQNVKDTVDNLIELADEFGPQLKKLVAKCFEFLTDSKNFDQLVVSDMAAQFTVAMLRDGQSYHKDGDKEIADRALTLAKLIVNGAKE